MPIVLKVTLQKHGNGLAIIPEVGIKNFQSKPKVASSKSTLTVGSSEKAIKQSTVERPNVIVLKKSKINNYLFL